MMPELWYFLFLVELSRKTQSFNFNEVTGAAALYVKFQEIVCLCNVGHVHNVCHLLTASTGIRIKWGNTWYMLTGQKNAFYSSLQIFFEFFFVYFNI
jgi:hypothetical protein